MGEKTKVLSERLLMLARMVTPGSRVADVGCDHAFLSIYLVQTGISPAVIAMDVRKGPLQAADEHIKAWGLGAYIGTRLSDGLEKLMPGEADTVICAGMGGRLMERILTEGMEKTGQLRELILQPQSELQEFREFLDRGGFHITHEDMVREDGKYYFAMRVVPGSANRKLQLDAWDAEQAGAAQFYSREDLVRLCYRYGEMLLLKKHPLLEEYLHRQENMIAALAESLAVQGTERTGSRLQELQQELADIRAALSMYERR